MTQAWLFIGLYLVGLAVNLAFGPRRHVHWSCASAFLIGLAVVVGGVHLIIASGAPYLRIVTLGMMLAILVGCGVRIGKHASPSRAELRAIGAWTAGFVVVTLVATSYCVTLLTFDSHYMLILSGSIADDRGLTGDMLGRLNEYGTFQVLAQSMINLTRERMLFSLSTMIGLAGLATFAVTLRYALAVLGVESRWRWAGVALVTATTFTVYMLWRHVFYVHTNLGSAIYLFLFLSCFWLGEVKREAAWLTPAFIALVAFALHRIESPLVAVGFCGITILGTALPARRVVLALAAFVAFVAGWYVFLGTAAPPASQLLTATKCYATAAGLVAFLGYIAVALLVRPAWMQALHRRAPLAIVAACGVILVAAIAAKPAHMQLTLTVLVHNLVTDQGWRGVWPAIAILGVLAVLTRPRVPAGDLLAYSVPYALLMIAILGFGREPYRPGVGDSGARMAIHVIPVVFFYFGLAFLPVALPRRAEAA